jgi:diadenosine tetraphosphate (Ap4A) HIT family hydrolase
MRSSGNNCPFCPPPADSILWTDGVAIAFADGFPISPGHTLIIPTRHVGTWKNALPEERSALSGAIAEVQEILGRLHSPDGFNVGFNDGAAAGQTVAHFHIHVIPRYDGDVPDPRGGIRMILPGKANYWSE